MKKESCLLLIAGISMAVASAAFIIGMIARSDLRDAKMQLDRERMLARAASERVQADEKKHELEMTAQRDAFNAQAGEAWSRGYASGTAAAAEMVAKTASRVPPDAVEELMRWAAAMSNKVTRSGAR